MKRFTLLHSVAGILKSNADHCPEEGSRFEPLLASICPLIFDE